MSVRLHRIRCSACSGFGVHDGWNTHQGECDEEVVLRALSKADADDNLPRLADVKMRLVNALTAVWSRAEDCTFASVLRAARHLVWECEQASSLAHRDVLPAYLPVTTDPAAAELASRLSRKRIEVKRLLEILENGLCETAELEGEPDALPEPRPVPKLGCPFHKLELVVSKNTNEL